jgi:hypothetical protein
MDGPELGAWLGLVDGVELSDTLGLEDGDWLGRTDGVELGA